MTARKPESQPGLWMREAIKEMDICSIVDDDAEIIARHYEPTRQAVERLVKAAQRVVKVTDVYGGCTLAEESELRAALAELEKVQHDK